MNESSPRAVLNTLIETCKDAERGLLHAAMAFKSAVEGAWPATVRDLVELGYADVRASHLRFDELNQVAL